MKILRYFIFLSLLFYYGGKCFAQAGYLHIELQGGYEYFSTMSNKSGFDFNIGCRYAFDDRYFAAAMLHSGINNGTYEGMYAGEKTDLDHTLREYMIGVGPGLYLYNGGNRWIYADLLAGYGFGEELKSSSDSRSESLEDFALALHLGAEYQISNGWVIGGCIGGYYVGGEIRPALNLKWGIFLNL